MSLACNPSPAREKRRSPLHHPPPTLARHGLHRRRTDSTTQPSRQDAREL
jgi:hypothetical protein